MTSETHTNLSLLQNLNQIYIGQVSGWNNQSIMALQQCHKLTHLTCLMRNDIVELLQNSNR
jgi:hypothetical protein